MCSQSKDIGSANMSASTYDTICTLPAQLHCAWHRITSKPSDVGGCDERLLRRLSARHSHSL